MKFLLSGTLALFFASPAFAQPRMPPQANCLDARQIGTAEGIGADSLAIRLKDGQRFHVQLAQHCPSPGQQLSVRGAAGGWLCGTPGEALIINGEHCPIDAVSRIDTRDYADLLRQRDVQGTTTTLAPMHVEGKRTARGFRGTADYCVGIDHLRSWSVDPQGVSVEVSPKRAAGNRFYRIELASGCPLLSSAQSMTLISGLGIGMVCGHPGDRMQLLRPEREMIRPGDPDNFSHRYECQISRVYPVQGIR